MEASENKAGPAEAESAGANLPGFPKLYHTLDGAMVSDGPGFAIAIKNRDFAAPLRSSIPDHEAAMLRLKRLVEGREADDHCREMCIVCENAGTSFCQRCRAARYCSRSCQTVDWPLHKKVCQGFADTSRPSSEHHRVLLFPACSSKPEIVWAIFEEENGLPCIHIDHDDLRTFQEKTGIDSTSPMSEHRGTTVLNVYNMHDTRTVARILTALTFTGTQPLPDSQAPKLLNQSISALSKPGYLRPWFGPIIIWATTSEGEILVFQDITPRDFHTAARFFKHFECNALAQPDRFPGEVISGLKVNDLGDEMNMAMGVAVPFERVSVPLCPSKCQDHIIAMAFLLGLRWYIRPISALNVGPRMRVWRGGHLRYLSLVIDIQNMGMGPEAADGGGQKSPYVDLKYTYGSYGLSVVILHGSGHPVDVHHVLAFNAYLDEMYVTKGVATRRDFEKSWAEYRQRMAGPVSAVPSPYKYEAAKFKDKLGMYDPYILMSVVRNKAHDL
ncbi:hypothetical protein VTK56DRAFT_4596 [Thermocarpiscus australiensis]